MKLKSRILYWTSISSLCLSLLTTSAFGTPQVKIEAKGGTEPISKVVAINDYFIGLGNSLYFSQTGKDWIKIRLPFGRAEEVVFENGMWVVLLNSTGEWSSYAGEEFLLTTKDLRNWQVQKVPKEFNGTSLITFNGEFVLLSYYNDVIAHSNDPTNWQKVDEFTQYSFEDHMVFEDALYVRIYDNETSSRFFIKTSDLIHWERSDDFVVKLDAENTTYLTSVTKQNGIFYGLVGSMFYRSIDGKNWERYDEPGNLLNFLSSDYFGVRSLMKSSKSLFLWTNTGALFYTRDGEHWTQRTQTFDRTVLYPSYSFQNNTFALVGDTAVFCDQKDLFLNTEGSANVETTLKSLFDGIYRDLEVVYFKNRFYTAGRNYQLWSSEDGLEWTEVMAYDNPSDISSRSYDDHLLTLYKNEDALVLKHFGLWMWTTTDGENWTKTRTTLNGEPVNRAMREWHWESYQVNSIRDLLWYDNQWVSQYEDGRPIYSEDAITWTTAPNFPEDAKIWDMINHEGLLIGAGNWAFHSEDGINWTQSALVGGATPYDITLWNLTNYSVWVVAWSPYDMVFSQEGKNWTRISFPETDSLNPLDHSGACEEGYGVEYDGRLYLINFENRSLTEVDQLTWLDAPILDAPFQMSHIQSGTLEIDADQIKSPHFEITALTDTISESSEAQNGFSIKRYGPLDEELIVQLQLIGDATEGIDFEILGLNPNHQIRFDSNQSQVDLKIQPVADPLDEGEESIAIYLQSSSLYSQTFGTQTALIKLVEE